MESVKCSIILNTLVNKQILDDFFSVQIYITFTLIYILVVPHMRPPRDFKKKINKGIFWCVGGGRLEQGNLGSKRKGK